MRTSIKKHQENELLLKQGLPSTTLYKVLSGSVSLYVNYGSPDAYLADTVTPGLFFGEMALLPGQKSYYSAVTDTKSVVIHIPQEAIEDFVLNDPKNLEGFSAALFRYIDAMSALLENLSRKTPVGKDHFWSMIDDRLAPHLKRALVRQIPPPEEPKQEFYLPGHRRFPGITHPEYKKYLFDKPLVCPNCRHRFPGCRVFYSSPDLVAVENPKAARYDLRIFYQDFEAEWYDIITCPACFFSAMDSFFVESKQLRKRYYEERLAKAKKEVSMDFEAERNLDFVFDQHYLALVCAIGFSEHRQIKAHIWTNLYWLYKGAGDQELASLAEARAVEAYKEVYSYSSLNPVQEQHLCLTVAGMLYRQGNIRGAREWAVKVRMNREGKRAYSNLAEYLIEEIREQMLE